MGHDGLSSPAHVTPGRHIIVCDLPEAHKILCHTGRCHVSRVTGQRMVENQEDYVLVVIIS